ncbi:hypothetical protein EXIGLDRAFT_780753 [Exidia glandulosa HHB12029]|uniref:DUF6533 domain-containing protein n=1 Tax=Exidia glandulosa HHB12029 TaxID=1314781 RepID=A0A165BGN0_EXIGL|nr:hypothetical protein EXIGLDRAFT_780753 [Exidia glandulosa HHB12029]
MAAKIHGTYNVSLIVAPIFIYLYDWALTIDQEVELIWHHKWSITKALFLVLRYGMFPLAVADFWTATHSGLSMKLCVVFGHSTISLMHWDRCAVLRYISGYGLLVLVPAVQLVLQLRIFAMYNKSRRLLFLNAALFLIQGGFTLYGMIVHLPQREIFPVRADIVGSCYSLMPKSLGFTCIAPLTFESYMAALALAKMIQNRRSYGSALKGDGILTLLV